MLLKLKIKNIALIDECVIDFENGLNTLTGETGAGKSIIIDALNFVLGARSDKTLIKSGTDTAKVDATFSTSDSAVLDMLEDYGIEKDTTIILSRTMTLLGRNECKINGEVVPLNMLKKVTEKLVDVFGQNDQQFLLNPKEHLSYLDGFIGDMKQKEELDVLIDKLHKVNDDIDELGGDDETRLRDIDILKYQISEIASSELTLTEEDELLERKKMMLNAEKISEKFSDFNLLCDGQVDILSNIKSMTNIVNSLSEYIGDFATLSTRLDSARLELQDIIETVKDNGQNFEYNEMELDKIEERLDLIKTLERKYGSTIADIFEYQKNAVDKLHKLENATEEIDNLKEIRKGILSNIYNVCLSLTEIRKQKATEMKQKIETELQNLGMKHAQFDVHFVNYCLDDAKNVTHTGLDDIEFLFSANLGEPLKPLSRIISGGELSRFMLALKTISQTSADKTYVFDEIDTGIGGSVGVVVAKQMSRISKYNQVLCITHLAQIASFADNMLKIEKYESDGKTYTSVKKLDDDGAVMEITRLIGTSQVNDFAIKHAEELIKEAEEFKRNL